MLKSQSFKKPQLTGSNPASLSVLCLAPTQDFGVGVQQWGAG